MSDCRYSVNANNGLARCFNEIRSNTFQQGPNGLVYVDQVIVCLQSKFAIFFDEELQTYTTA
jgi:hypothetical protein